MKDWQRRTIGVLTLGGSAIGLVAIFTNIPLFQVDKISLAIVSVFILLFLYGLYVGVLTLESRDSAYSLLLPFWVAQVPVVQSHYFSYGLYTGVKFDVLLKSNADLGFEWSGGAHFTFQLFPGDSLAIGANVAAIVVVSMIWKNRRRAF